MRIAFFEIENWEKDFLNKSLGGNELVFFEEKLSDAHLKKIKDSKIVSPFIYSVFNARTIKQLPRLKLIATRSTGYDHIDLTTCRKRGIVVSNVPSYGENTVAEHTFALILSLSRRLKESFERTSHGNFSLEGLRGFDLKGRTLGIVGLGRIGRKVARIAHGFGMKILAFDVRQDKTLVQELNLSYTGLVELLAHSDIITLHVPYNEQTDHLINKENIKLFKPGSLLINTARGGVVDTEAVIYGLDKKILAGVGLDVLEGEALIKEERQLLSKNLPKERLKDLLTNHILLKYENVVVTPHNAFNSGEALQRILETTVENIHSFLKDKPQHVVR